jgi:hypothetical protein
MQKSRAKKKEAAEKRSTRKRELTALRQQNYRLPKWIKNRSLTEEEAQQTYIRLLRPLVGIAVLPSQKAMAAYPGLAKIGGSQGDPDRLTQHNI